MDTNYCKEINQKQKQKYKCEHDKSKQRCRLCGGSQICNHDIQKQTCKICSPQNFCSHDRRKRTCKECVGIDICEHGERKTQCKICVGSEICEHKIYKSRCKECKGSQICKHDIQKQNCKICGGVNLCQTPLCQTRAIKKYNGHCLNCFIHLFPDVKVSRNYKTKEKEVVDKIIQTFTTITWILDKKVLDGCSKRRPDILGDMGTHIIIIEVDENKHTNYDSSCENKRLMELSQDLYYRPIVFIRFNPDDFTNSDGILVKSCWKFNKNGILQIMKTKQNC